AHRGAAARRFRELGAGAALACAAPAWRWLACEGNPRAAAAVSQCDSYIACYLADSRGVASAFPSSHRGRAGSAARGFVDRHSMSARRTSLLLPLAACAALALAVPSTARAAALVRVPQD